MAGISLKALVLHGARVVNDVVTGKVRLGFDQAWDQAPARSSYPRRLSPSSPRTGYPSEERLTADLSGEDAAANKAGRPGNGTVLVRRNPAMRAGRTVLSGWSDADGSPRLTATGCIGFLKAKAPVARAKGLPKRPRRFHPLARQRMDARLAWPMPAGGTCSARRGERETGGAGR